LVYVGPPDESARLQIFNIHTRNMPCALDVNIRDLSIRTKGYTGADIAGICREAAMAALEVVLYESHHYLEKPNFSVVF
jgi:SpoVK/Ycf46/Vps4 family AAA+-type ATPase